MPKVPPAGASRRRDPRARRSTKGLRFLIALNVSIAVMSTHANATEKLGPVYNAVLAGDGVQALALLAGIDAASLDAAESKRATCIRAALLAPPRAETLPATSNAILFAYRTYWQQVLTRKLSREEAEAQLKRRLDAILAAGDPAYADSESLDVASERAKQAVERDGLFALAGITAPYYELAIWKTQRRQNYDVDLNDRRVATEVVFLDDFVSFGWAGYATCDRVHTSGWATDKALFAVASSYDLASEAFRVSYLAHEARHFSDYARFPKLASPELEYRAKLTELALADATAHRLIVTFSQRAGDDRAVPHGYANRVLARQMAKTLLDSDVPVTDAERWERVPAADIRGAAQALLAVNDASLAQQDPQRVERFLGD